MKKFFLRLFFHIVRGIQYTWDTCELCGFEFEFMMDNSFEVIKSWIEPGTPDGPEKHWFLANLTCPRCGYKFEVEDSN